MARVLLDARRNASGSVDGEEYPRVAFGEVTTHYLARILERKTGFGESFP
jgi:hypothetical protein